MLVLIFVPQQINQDKQTLILRNHELVQTSTTTQVLREDLHAVYSDLMVLAHSPAMKEMLEQGHIRDHHRLEELFLAMAGEKKIYGMIRYLDSSGVEVVNAVSTPHGAEIIPAKHRQNEGDRSYFKDTLHLPPNGLYVSPFELNVENGKIEIPYKPTLRFGTPVHDKHGQAKGVIVISYSGQKLLDDFNRGMLNHGHSMLLNTSGYWLKGIDAATPEWGFMLGDKQTFAQRLPEEWQKITAKDQGSFLTGQGQFTFNTIYPLPESQDLATINPASPATATPTEKQQRFWKIVSWVPSAELPSHQLVDRGFVWIYALSLLVLAILSRYFAKLLIGRRALQQSLSESDKRLREITELMPVALFVKDAASRIVMMNKASEEQFGLSFADVHGTDASQYFPPEQMAHFLATDAAVFSEGKLVDIEEEVWNTKLKQNRHMRTLKQPVYDHKGAPLYLIGMGLDITEQKQDDKMITELLEERIKNSLKDVSDIRFAMDQHTIVAVTNPQGKITYVNDKFCAISKYSREELIGQDHRMINSGYHSKEFMHELWRTIAQGKPWKGELRNRAKDGSLYWVDTTIVPYLDAAGQPYQYVALRSDITEIKIMDQALHNHNMVLQHAVEAANTANELKSEFISTMSHEIRTPLTGILGMLELLSMTPLNNEQRATMEVAWNSSKGLLRIVSDILDWTKIEEGKLELSPRPTSITQLLQDVMNTYSGAAQSRSLTLRLHVNERLKSAYIVDPLRLSQILNNFVSNAIKFTHQGEIELDAEILDHLERSDRIQFSVRDTGIGIAKEAQHFLFQRYTQESRDTARLYGGTGLGLSICRRLAEMMDGQIDLQSEPGQGSIFSLTLTLPVAALPVESLRSNHSEASLPGIDPLFADTMDAPLVLVVDDHPTIRALLARQLKLFGLRVEAAENGNAALPMWRDGRYALVITDCQMPEMDGFELSREIRKIEADEGLPRIPIIAFTANAFAEEAEHCRTAGMDEVLIKPADLAQIKKILGRWLSIPGKDSSESAACLHKAECMQNAGPIDYSVLEQVVPDRAEHMQVLHDFKLHICADYEKMIKMLEQGDQINVGNTAHRMQGSCRMVGASDMANACADIEHAARNGGLASVRSVWSALDKAMEQFEQFLLLTGNREVSQDETK